MKIENRTNWKTADLRAIARKIAAAELNAKQRRSVTVVFNACRHQKYQRDAHGYCSTSGIAYLSGGFARGKYVGSLRVDSYIQPNTIFIHMPTAFDTLNEIETLDFCSTVAHEFAHVRTRKCGQAVEIAMRKSVPYGMWSRLSESARGKQRTLYAWALSMPLRKESESQPADKPAPVAVAATPAAAGPTLIERRAAKAAATLARWEAELDRRERAVKRAKRKVSAARRRVAYYAKRETVAAG